MAAGLVDRHLSFLRALRQAGLAVSLAEDVDAVAALAALPWDDRATVRAAYAATVLKRQGQRPTFDALFDVYFPRLVGEGARADPDDDSVAEDSSGERPDGVRDNAAALQDFRERLAEALATDDAQLLDRLATEMVGRFGAMPGRGPGMSSWSAYTANQRVAPQELAARLRAALGAGGRTDEEADRTAGQRIGGFVRRVEDDARRRIAEEKGADHVADVTVRPSIERIDFLSARRSDLADLRREIQPLARRLATRLTREQRGPRGALDFRRTIRTSMSTGGVPITTRHRPKRPHRNDLVVLCDVSGSVANFAQFTLLLMLALRDQFQQVRAFTFVDRVHEVTPLLRPGADPGQVLADLAASTAEATRWGRTDYGRAFTDFAREHPDALGPKSALLVLGDARSNYSDLALDVLGGLADEVRHAWWLNPEARRHWNTGDSAAGRYGEIVAMVECRNLDQLGRFVHDIL